MSDKPERCPDCNGLGYIRCDCWPGDCICGYGDETCEECGGDGVIYDNYDDYLDERDHRFYGGLI